MCEHCPFCRSTTIRSPRGLTWSRSPTVSCRQYTWRETPSRRIRNTSVASWKRYRLSLSWTGRRSARERVGESAMSLEPSIHHGDTHLYLAWRLIRSVALGLCGVTIVFGSDKIRVGGVGNKQAPPPPLHNHADQQRQADKAKEEHHRGGQPLDPDTPSFGLFH